MRIGIDIDDTICKTTEKVQERLDVYSNKKQLTPLDIMNNELLKEQFFQEESSNIYENVEPKKDVKEVLKRLRKKGNTINIITSRSNNLSIITKEWLKREDIEIDDITFSVDGEEKAKVCKEKQIDLMIEDNPLNYKKIKESGINCILYDDHGKFDLKENYYTNWPEIERYIERNH